MVLPLGRSKKDADPKGRKRPAAQHDVRLSVACRRHSNGPELVTSQFILVLDASSYAVAAAA